MVTVMNNSVVVNEEPVRNGIRNIELCDISKLGYQRVIDAHGHEKITLAPLPSDDSGVTTPTTTSSMTGSTESVYSKEHVSMKKGVGLLSGVALIVGTMIGTFYIFYCIFLQQILYLSSL